MKFPKTFLAAYFYIPFATNLELNKVLTHFSECTVHIISQVLIGKPTENRNFILSPVAIPFILTYQTFNRVGKEASNAEKCFQQRGVSMYELDNSFSSFAAPKASLHRSTVY